jgi:hypothetical protein
MKQIGGLLYPLVKTIDNLVFYELCGEYYARKKSSLSSDRVKTSPEFRRTMVHANLLARASKIGAAIYKALPPSWRQFWMYRSFTGEAFILLQDNPYDDETVKQLLWKCYVEYWEQRRVIDPDNTIFQPKPKKIRKRRKYSEESIKRLLKRKDKHGRSRYRDLEEEERKRQHKAMNKACYERTMEKYRRLAEEQLLEEKLRATSFEPRASTVTEQALEQEVKAVPALLRRAKGPGIVMRGCKPRRAKTRLRRWGQRSHNSLIPQLARRRARKKAFELSDTS